jgi:hypothetical protein
MNNALAGRSGSIQWHAAIVCGMSTKVLLWSVAVAALALVSAAAFLHGGHFLHGLAPALHGR